MQLLQTQDTIRSAWNGCSYTKMDSSFSLFTNGTTVYRANGSKMPNGDTLAPTHYTLVNYPFGSPFSQGCLIVNKPLSDSIIFMFYQGIDNDISSPFSTKLYQAVINVNADSGKGVVISKNIILYNGLDTLMYGKLQAVRHSNGLDWWLISKRQNQNEFLVWLIQNDTIAGPNRFTYLGPKGLDSFYDQASVSSDGSKYAIIFRDMRLQLFDFNRCTGEFRLIFNNILNDPNGVGGGVAFSASGHFLYATTGLICWQFDMTALDIFDSGLVIADYDGFIDGSVMCDFHFCRTAPDGKIYISPGSSNSYWGRINNPELPGTLADLEQHIVNLYCYNNVNFPNLPNFNLGPVSANYCDSINTIDEISTSKIMIGPNPAREYLYLKGKIKFPISYSLFDITSRVLKSESLLSTNKICVSDLKLGIYILSLIDLDGKVQNFKFIKE
jgi:hypothetical protein